MQKSNTESVSAFADFAASAAGRGVLRLLVFSLPRDRAGAAKKVCGTLKKIGANTVLQLEYSLSEGRLRHENILLDGVADKCSALAVEYSRGEAYIGDKCASLMISKKGKATFLCPKNLSDSDDVRPIGGNDREKNYLIPETAPFLHVLGISDASGRVKDKRRAKFRQINKFCEYALDILKDADPGAPVRIADMCCGKSYLSFALYYVVTNVLKRECEMVCVDLKQSVIDDVSTIAENAGFSGMTFICADITGFEPPFTPDLVVSLHACDIATDIVLDFAVKCRAARILSTPCCHHELAGIIDSPELSFITRHSVLRQKLCSAATDSLRLLRLECAGYKVDAVEFVDPEDTPKNVMLRAVYTGRVRRGAVDEYAAACDFLNRSGVLAHVFSKPEK